MLFINLFSFVISPLFFFFADKFSCVSNFGIILCIVLPLLFAHIEGDDQHSACIWTHIGLVLWVLLFRSTSHPYCWPSSRLLHYNSHTKSTNRATVIANECKMSDHLYAKHNFTFFVFFSFLCLLPGFRKQFGNGSVDGLLVIGAFAPHLL